MVIDRTSNRQWKKNHRLVEFGLNDPLHASRAMDNKQTEAPKMANKEKEKWDKVENTTVRFEKPGDEVSGILVGVEDGKQFGNKVFKIQSGDKTLVVFGTAVIESQMTGIPAGTEVMIRFTGTKPSKNKSFNDIKMFDVFTAGN